MRSSEEILDEVNEGFGETEFYIPTRESEEYFSSESSLCKINCLSKWRQTPREPSYFSDCKSPVSSCKDSDYEAWLANYYDELLRAENRPQVVNKFMDTFDLEEEAAMVKQSPALAVFANTAPEESTKYWGIQEVRRHWPLPKTSRQYFLFPSIHPMLNVSSRYGRYFCCLHSASAIPEIEHKRRLCSIFKLNLLRARRLSQQFTKLMLCDTLVYLSWFDLIAKKVVITALCQLLRNQRHVKIVSLENAQLLQLEGIILLCALSKNGGDTIRELHLWKMFAYGQCPVLRDTCSVAEKSKNNGFGNPNLTYHYLEILNHFSNLTHLSINYAYLANRDGCALLGLKAVNNGCLMELRLLCLREERPLLTNPNCGVGGYNIPDGVWKRVTELSPKMRVLVVFLNMPQYENIILFLTKNIPISSFYVSSGIDLKFETPWEIDTTLLQLRNWYSNTLVILCLHLWHHRDLLDYVIEYKILDEFPQLLTFEYIGILRCLTTLEGFCRRLLTGQYKLKHLLFWVEEAYSYPKKRKDTIEKVAQIKQLYLQKLQNINIDADIKTHPI